MLETAPSPNAFPPPPVDPDVAGLAREFVDAIVGGDFDRLEALLTPDVRFRALIPREYKEASTAADARAIVEDWFDGTESCELIGWTVERVGDKVAIGYRVELTEASVRRVVEQHGAATVVGARFGDIALVCSGFRPVAADSGAVARQAAGSSDEGGAMDSRSFTPSARLDATGLSCATLTPTVSATVRGLDFGAVLEIVSDDPEAENDLRSWTRLTGNELIPAAAGSGQTRRFGIRRTQTNRANTWKGAR